MGILRCKGRAKNTSNKPHQHPSPFHGQSQLQHHKFMCVSAVSTQAWQTDQRTNGPTDLIPHIRNSLLHETEIDNDLNVDSEGKFAFSAKHNVTIVLRHLRQIADPPMWRTRRLHDDHNVKKHQLSWKIFWRRLHQHQILRGASLWDEIFQSAGGLQMEVHTTDD